MFDCFKRKKIGVVILDKHIQITYNQRVFEKVFPYNTIFYRTVSRFKETEAFVKQTFKEILPKSISLFGKVDVYVTNNPLSGEIENRALRDVFSRIRCVKRVYTVFSQKQLLLVCKLIEIDIMKK